MAGTSLSISSRNYSSWSLRGWLLCKFADLDFETVMLPVNDASARAELLLLSPSFLTPCLTYEGLQVWDTLAIAEFLNELKPQEGLLPAERDARDRCRSICGELTMADAMYAPVCTRFATYDVALDPVCAAYRDRILALPYMKEWTAAALTEPDEVEELEVEF